MQNNNSIKKILSFDDMAESLGRIENVLVAIYNNGVAASKIKEFYTPKEFSHLTGIKYSTVVYRCKMGKLKARQDTPCSTWQIHVDELERYRNEANENAY